ncbi:MAG: site-specific DNA-methyltransferase [Elusimicrobiota bacterium]|jgi:DNA modification methylase|nr:site-specific DNA-methyltransferase [Elusimicrobiota bacterium]
MNSNLVEYKTIKMSNNFSFDEIKRVSPELEKAGVIASLKNDDIFLKFDIVDIMHIKRQNNDFSRQVLGELLKIKSFSTANGKTVFASFNKDRKVQNKSVNKSKRAGYEYYKKDFDNNNNEINAEMLDKIYCKDSASFLKTLPDNCIDLIFTSPPYNFGINYNSTDDSNKWNDYFNQLYAVFDECIRILKNSGRIIVNIQPLFSDYIPSHHLISNFFFKKGLIWKGEIMWEKNNYSCKYCTWGSWKSPSAPYLKYSWEFIEIFCKNSLKKDGKKDDIDIKAEEFKQWVYAKWSIAPERKMKKYKHDAMFPEELAKRAIKLFSYKNDIVLDPFNGVGTTTKVADILGRRFIGIDIDKQYCKTAQRRLENDLFYKR